MEKLTSVPLYEQVGSKIKQMIMSGEYNKGDLLPSESDLCDMMGVSRISVREALKRLQELGIIEKFKGKGSVVRLDASDFVQNEEDRERFIKFKKNFEDAVKAKLIFEPEIARQAALIITDAQAQEIEDLLTQQSRKSNKEKLDDFHRCLVAVLNNPLMLEFYDKVEAQCATEFVSKTNSPSEQKTQYKELARQHFKIFEAIKAHDSEFAYFYMKEHILYSTQIHLSYFNSF